MPQKPADSFHSVILPFLNFILPLELIIWCKYYLIALAQGHFQSNFPTPSHIQVQTLSTESWMGPENKKCKRQCLGISVKSCPSCWEFLPQQQYSVWGTVSITLHLHSHWERCCFQGLLSNTCSAPPPPFQRDAGCYREAGAQPRWQLPSHHTGNGTVQLHSSAQLHRALPTWGLLKRFVREGCCSFPLTGTWNMAIKWFFSVWL